MTAAEWLDAIEVRATTATPGPWRDGMGTHGLGADGPSFVTVDAIAANGAVNRVAELMLDKDGAADAEFIANARADIPALAAALRAVLALHVPAEESSQGYTEHGYGYVAHPCTGEVAWDEYAIPWPCPTVAAITAALDGAS